MSASLIPLLPSCAPSQAHGSTAGMNENEECGRRRGVMGGVQKRPNVSVYVAEQQQKHIRGTYAAPKAPSGDVWSSGSKLQFSTHLYVTEQQSDSTE